MSSEFGWDVTSQGNVLAAFSIGYTVGQLPGGMLAQRLGGKRPIGMAMFVNSMLLLTTPLMLHLCKEADTAGMYVFILILLGMFIGTVNPCFHWIISRWAHIADVNLLHNTIYSGFNVGLVASSMTAGVLSESLGWQSVFYIWGSLYAVAGIAWVVCVYESPELVPESNAPVSSIPLGMDGPLLDSEDAATDRMVTELKISEVDWRGLLTCLPFWALMINKFAWDWSIYTVLKWTPSWLYDTYQVDIKDSGYIAALPSILGFIVCVLSGVLAKWMTTKMSKTAVRKIMQCAALLAPGAFFAVIAWANPNATVGIVSIVAAGGLMNLGFSGVHVNPIDLYPEAAAPVYAIVNATANISGWVMPIISAGILKREGKVKGWRYIFMMSIGVQLVGMLVWVAFASGERQFASTKDGRRTTDDVV